MTRRENEQGGAQQAEVQREAPQEAQAEAGKAEMLCEALAEAARAERRSRLPEAAVWRAFAAADPHRSRGDEARALLLQRLEVLAAAGRIRLPARGGAGWDRGLRPSLPVWVQVVQQQRAEPFDPRGYPWAPELSFVADMPRIEHPEELMAIQRFLAGGGRRRPIVPMRERSIQLFGDEKRLEQLRRSSLFSSERLSLETLRCAAVSPPLALEAGPPGSGGRPMLILENHHPWWSFCQWNRRHGCYSHVVYGAGAGFGAEAVRFLHAHITGADPRREAADLHYAGDLDAEGLRIPWRAAKLAEELGLRLLPAERWYRRMLEQADALERAGVVLSCGEPIATGPELEWLPVALQEPVRRAFAAGRRIPQEVVGSEELAAEGVEG